MPHSLISLHDITNKRQTNGGRTSWADHILVIMASSNLNKPKKKKIIITPNEKLKKNYLQVRCDVLFYNPPDCL